MYRHCKPRRARETYWICCFSNNQWNITGELGNGDWQKSSFYQAWWHRCIYGLHVAVPAQLTSGF